MRTATALFAASLLVTTGVMAQDTKPATEVPPPPAMNSPGVKAAPQTTTQPLDLTPRALPAAPVTTDPDRPDDSLPQVDVRKKDGTTVQEYSRGGRVYMVVVTPRNGITQTYMVDPQGNLLDTHGKKVVGPVMYQVMEWGKSKSAPPPADRPARMPEPAPASTDGKP